MGRAKILEHLVKEGLLEDIQELKIFEKRMVSVFVFDKRKRKICRSTKVIQSLVFLGVKTHRVIKDTAFFMWNLLLPTAEDCLEMGERELIKEHEGQRRTWSSIRGSYSGVGRLLGFFMLYGQILEATPDNLNGGWGFDIMLDPLAFVWVPNCLDFMDGKCRSLWLAKDLLVGVKSLVTSPPVQRRRPLDIRPLATQIPL